MTAFTVVIPARYASERLPGKPLREIAGKPLLQHVYARAVESDATAVVVATDDERIRRAAEDFGADVCMTSGSHRSGSERIAEVCEIRDWDPARIVVNLQGDEPLMPPALVGQCARLLDDGSADIGTLASPMRDRSDFLNPNVVKVIVGAQGYALYFSRAAIPYSRSKDTDEEALACARHHHGIYAYRVGVLRRLVAAEAPPLELCEQLEQLRALHIGLTIRVGTPETRPGPGVDTEADLDRAGRLLSAVKR